MLKTLALVLACTRTITWVPQFGGPALIETIPAGAEVVWVSGPSGFDDYLTGQCKNDWSRMTIHPAWTYDTLVCSEWHHG